MFEKFYPAFVDMTMALGFPVFSVDEKNPLKVVFSEIERGDDVSERFERLRERFMELLTKDLSHSRFAVSLFFPPNMGEHLYSKEVNILIGHGVRRGVAEIHINIPRKNRSLNVVVSDGWIHVEKINENYQVLSFERPDDAVEYIRNFVVEQGSEHVCSVQEGGGCCMRLIEKTILNIVQKLPIYRILIWSGDGWMRKKTPTYEGFVNSPDGDKIRAHLNETLAQTSVESRCVLDLPRNQLLLIDRMEKGARLVVKVCGNGRSFDGFVFNFSRSKLYVTPIVRGVLRTRRGFSASKANELLIEFFKKKVSGSE